MNFLQEPVFVLEVSGLIANANAAARRLLGTEPVGRRLHDFVATSDARFRAWLRLCSGTTAPLIGAVTLRGDKGDLRLRVHGARLPGEGDPMLVAVRCMPADTRELSVLARQVRDLNAEIRERRRVQAVLEEALARNEMLLRELHHRVRNNVQILQALFAAAQREAESHEVKRFLEDANRRLLAIGAAQSLMYQAEQLASVPAAEFMRSLCAAVGDTLGPDVRIDMALEEGVELHNETSFPLALIINELLTNAFKHGLKGGRGTIRVAFGRRESRFELVVEDDGPGFSDERAMRRSSGLGLVRGLCRQLGGDIVIEHVGGARVTVRFDDPLRQNTRE